MKFYSHLFIESVFGESIDKMASVVIVINVICIVIIYIMGSGFDVVLGIIQYNTVIQRFQAFIIVFGIKYFCLYIKSAKIFGCVKCVESV